MTSWVLILKLIYNYIDIVRLFWKYLNSGNYRSNLYSYIYRSIVIIIFFSKHLRYYFRTVLNYKGFPGIEFSGKPASFPRNELIDVTRCLPFFTLYGG